MSKEQQVNKDKAEGIVKNALASGFVAKATVVAKTTRTVVLIVLPLVIAGYLYETQTDKVVLALGVAIALVGTINLVKTAYRAEAKSSKRR